MQRTKKSSTEEDPEDRQSWNAGLVLKAGAAVAGTVLLALGAWSLASSSTSSESEGRRKSIEKSVPDGVGVRGRGSGGYMAEDYQPHRWRPSNYTGEGNQYNGSRLIKIMSYNVWFCKDVEVHERMRAIGHLILKYLPEIIFFQEVTPNIYGIFQCSSWWQAYNCSVSPEKANRRYFCMLLSKLPVKEFSCKRFDNSMMGRELCIADVDVGLGKKLLLQVTSRVPLHLRCTAWNV